MWFTASSREIARRFSQVIKDSIALVYRVNRFINQIVCGDCVASLREFPENVIDLTITSPPFDNLRGYTDGAEFGFPDLAKELYRVTKPGGVVVWVAGDETVDGSETGTSMRQALYFKDEAGFNLHDTMVFRRNSVKHPDKLRYYNCWQYMFVFSKGRPKTINLIRDHRNKTAGKKETAKTQREKDGSFVPKWGIKVKKVRPLYSVRWNVWTYDVGSLIMAEDRLWVEHPAVFPLKLAEDHVRTWTEEGDLVLDPMCGSGMVPIAAKKLKRTYVGLDVSAEYCELSRKRLALY